MMNESEIENTLVSIKAAHSHTEDTSYRYCIDCNLLSSVRDSNVTNHLPEECEEEHTVISKDNHHNGLTEWIEALEYILER